MDFEYSAKTRELLARLTAFMDEHVYPNEKRYAEEVRSGDRWQPVGLIEPQLSPQAQGAESADTYQADRALHAMLARLTGGIEMNKDMKGKCGSRRQGRGRVTTRGLAYLIDRNTSHP